MRSTASLPLLLLPLLPACWGENPGDGWGGENGEKAEAFALPVRVTRPSRSDVEDYVETQANLESDRQVTIVAEADAQVVERVLDVGARVGAAGNGKDPFLLARLDDRDLALALRGAEINLEEAHGRVEESRLEQRRTTRLLDQANVALDEATAVFGRTSNGIKDGTISREEHETATFALDKAKTAVAVAQAALDKAKVALELGNVAIRKAEVLRDRATVALEKTVVRSSFAGVVTACHIQQGEWVNRGQALYKVEDTSRLVVYGDIPVRQARRIRQTNRVLVHSTAATGGTTGKVLLVAPTVSSASGTVRVKMQIESAPGYKPGLFVTLRIVVEQRTHALVVPKHAVLHHDEEGAYLFVVSSGEAKETEAARRLVETGFERGDMVEIVQGIVEGDRVVVEGQDTLTAGARVEIKNE